LVGPAYRGGRWGLTEADFLESSTGREASGWPSFLLPLFHRREEDVRISNTTIARRLGSGMVIVIAAFAKSASNTTVEYSIFASKTPNAAQLESAKMQILLETDQMIAKWQDGRNQRSLATQTTRQSHILGVLEKHLGSERKLGVEIHPASRSQNFSMEGKADDDCKKFPCRMSNMH
jgi:hypothetical protein